MNFSEFSQLLSNHFSRDEFRALYLSLGVNYESASSESVTALSVFLVEACRDRGMLSNLLELCRNERSNVDWPQVEGLTVAESDDLLVHPYLPVYLEWVVEQYNVMRLLSMQRPLPLEIVYTDVYLLEKDDRRATDDSLSAGIAAFARRELGFRGERQSGIEMLGKEQYLFIQGQPGAGKTIFLRWLAVRSAQAELDLNRIPFLVELRQLNDEHTTLTELLVKSWLLSGFPKHVTSDYVEKLIRSGQALILLDGLDEVRDEQRESVNNQIDDLVKRSGESIIVVTCRPHAVTRKFEKFTYIEMAEFTPAQVAQFVSNWFGEDKEKAQNLIRALQNPEHKPVQELTQTPLLLALVCITYGQEGELLQKRADLYEKALGIVLNEWDETRGIKRDSVYGQLTTKRKADLLAFVAYHSFEKGQLFIPQNKLEELVEAYWQSWRQGEIAYQQEEYGHVQPSELPVKTINAKKIITEIASQHGLLVEQFAGIYSFAHLSFQEYFTAKYIASNVRQGALRQLRSHTTEDQWREVFLLTVSLLDDVAEYFSLLLETLYEMSKSTSWLQRCLMWAHTKAEILNEENQLSYKLPAIRAWYFALASMSLLTLGLADDRNDSLIRAFFSTGPVDIARFLDPELELDMMLVRSRNHFRHCAAVIERRYAQGRDPATDIVWFLLKIDDFLYICDLSARLNHVDFNNDLVKLSVPDLASKNWLEFAESFSYLIEKYRDLSSLHSMQVISKADRALIKTLHTPADKFQDQYLAYLNLTRLLIDSMSLVLINNQVNIEGKLFSPLELEKS